MVPLVTPRTLIDNEYMFLVNFKSQNQVHNQIFKKSRICC